MTKFRIIFEHETDDRHTYGNADASRVMSIVHEALRNSNDFRNDMNPNFLGCMVINND